MDALATVQLIPVINYLNLLSDFLFVEKFITEYDQHKPIPIVNGLYQYFEDHRSNKTLILKLIRSLLLGSDLYGEKENENIDVIFVNTMFDYIITSLVFAKYGNIYGFLADTIRQEENLQFDYILGRIKENLRKAEFENEYGNSSTLTELSVRRIFNDLLMPLFPKPTTTNLNLLSLDYIFAQAGSMYLRHGKLNETYYSNFKKFTSTNNENDTFQEYRVIGYIVENLLHHKIIDPIVMKIFALPALFHYVSKEQKTKNQTIEKVIFDPHHWESAYDLFFTYIENAFTKIDNQLKNDYTYQLHKMFTNFHSRAKYAKLVLELMCKFLNEHYRRTRISVYVDNADYFECRNGDVLPNINEWFAEQVHDFGEIYEKYDLGMTANLFNDSLTELWGIVIKLVLTGNKQSDSTLNNSSQYLSYDLLEFFNTNNQTIDYYALVRVDYSVTLIKESDDPVNFKKIIGPPLDDYKRSAKRIILKFANETTQQLTEELMKYKKDRFKSYLNRSQTNLNNHEWWREFGLSLLPHYPCFTNYTEDYYEIEQYVCERDNIRFLNKFQEDVSLHLIDKETKRLLLSLGSDIKTIFINNVIDEYIIDEIEKANGVLIPFLKKTTLKAVYEKFALQIEEPKMETLGTTLDEIKFIENVILHLEWKSNRLYTNVKNLLIKMKIMKVNYPLTIGEIRERKLNYSLFVNSWNGLTGYGFKFTIIYKAEKPPIIAELRTDYEFKDKIFITQIYDPEMTNSSQKERKYIKLNHEVLESENDVLHIVPVQNLSNSQRVTLKTNQKILRTKNRTQDLVYESNNQLWRNMTKISFHGISHHKHNDDKCNVNVYLQKTKDSNLCSRHWCYIDKTDHDRMIIRDLLKHRKDENLLLEYQILDILRKYTFSNDSAMRFFFKNWMNDKQFKNSYWSKNNIVDKSGLLNKLLFETRLENEEITNLEGEMRINSIYSYRERYEIEEDKTLENIIKDYNDQQADYTIMFEDYYAVRNFATTGYRRINADTREAKLMKNALYKLSIRQAHDSEEEFDLKLFYFDSIPIDIFQREYMKEIHDVYWAKSIVLQKFTLASTNEESAVRFAGQPEKGFRNILFEMKFYGPYLRAKIDVEVKQTVSFKEKKVILPPGSEFLIEKMGTGPIEKIRDYSKIILIYKLKHCENYDRYKDIMSQIANTKM